MKLSSTTGSWQSEQHHPTEVKIFKKPDNSDQTFYQEHLSKKMDEVKKEINTQTND